MILFILCPRSECNGVFTAKAGTLQSLNYPARYDNNLDCSLIIKAPKDSIIHIIFDAFDVEFGQDCEYDYLMVNIERNVHARHCGNAIPEDLSISTDILEIAFITDMTEVGSGFRLSYTVISAKGQGECRCTL
ncbi:hypothetical protein CAPTEDRAFT_144166 [Capitella teleta]|uniref:CUB domain-containing protein n=1 Tax=Capitella teleta TaxID=283909 RepID=R7TSP5_CAPTE|nr:hypothetical protein CAPTEDRAFT_144166 [Capitella teleta]|eukprot:ELT96674.1 hypothetical protein CAPTEDRAFT_144166 [Capitella teleta]